MSEIVLQQIKQLLGEDLTQIESPSLKFDKYTKPREKANNNDSDNALLEVKNVVNNYNGFPFKLKRVLWKGFQHPKAVSMTLELKGHLIVNHSESIIENGGICLNRNMGYAYIPGSAIKGCCRHYLWELWHDENKPEEKKKIACFIAEVFGYPTGDKYKQEKAINAGYAPMDCLDDYLEQEIPEIYGKKNGSVPTYAGTVSFLPATTIEGDRDSKLAMDILTCHHRNYYNGELPVALDIESPIPLAFPVVKDRTLFRFQLLPLSKKMEDKMEKLYDYLAEALEYNGIGSKTSAGYGWFIEREADKQKRKAEHRRAIELATQIAPQNVVKNPVNTPQVVNEKPDFVPLKNKNWRDFSSEVKNLWLNSGENFSAEAKKELIEVIKNNQRLKPRDLKGGKKSLVNWLGEDLANEITKIRGAE